MGFPDSFFLGFGCKFLFDTREIFRHPNPTDLLHDKNFINKMKMTIFKSTYIGFGVAVITPVIILTGTTGVYGYYKFKNYIYKY